MDRWTNRFVSGHDFSRAEKREKIWALAPGFWLEPAAGSWQIELNTLRTGNHSETVEKEIDAMATAKAHARLRERFNKEVAPALAKELGVTNPMAVPRLHKIVVNMGVGEATQNSKVLDPLANDLGHITGQ